MKIDDLKVAEKAMIAKTLPAPRVILCPVCGTPGSITLIARSFKRLASIAHEDAPTCYYILPDWLTPYDAANLAGITPMAIYNAIRRGRLPAEKRDGAPIRIDPGDLRDYITRAPVRKGWPKGTARKQKKGGLDSRKRKK